MIDPKYRAQVELLLQTIPYVAKEKMFALNGGTKKEIKTGFLVALISHMRPINELLNLSFIDQRNAFEAQFTGMANIPFGYEEFEQTQKKLVSEKKSKLTSKDQEFLLSFKKADPIWDYFSVENARELPAVRWKLQNIERLKRENPKKHTDLANTLYKVLFD
jgi:hypothetical protein